MEPHSSYERLIETARSHWAGVKRISVLRELTEGKSGAGVFLVDVDSAGPGGGPPPEGVLRGEYLLKTEISRANRSAEPSEASRHQMVVATAPDFAKEHIPRLVRNYEDKTGNVALLYEIAGGRLSAVIGGYQLPAVPLQNLISQLGAALLDRLNTNPEVRVDKSASDVVRDWLGYRLDPEQAAPLHDFVRTETSSHQEYSYFGNVLINPLWLCTSKIADDDRSNASFWGLIHGDLHPANVLLRRDDIAAEQYWLIDFALARQAPILYDHAYYELAVLLQQTGEQAPEPFIRLLKALDADHDGLQTMPLRVADRAWVDCLRIFRQAATSWQQATEPQRADAFDKQFLLARVAAGINWCNKPIPLPLKRLSLASAGWAATQYMERYQSASLNTMRTPEVPAPPAAEKWTQVWTRLAEFDPAQASYVLVSGHVRGTAAAPLAMLPWSAVIDLDARSEDGGLFDNAGSKIKGLRSLMQFGKRRVDFDPTRGTGWVMCGGWESNYEPAPQNLDDWRRGYIAVIRDALERVKSAGGLRPVKVLILAPDGNDEQKIQRILLEVDEQLGSPKDVVVIANNLRVDGRQAHHVDADAEQFLAFLREIVGASVETTEYELPARGEADSTATTRVKVPLDKLRNLQEDLEVLHSRVLLEAVPQSAGDDAFWRGNPATWVDLHSSIDVRRDTSARLLELVRRVLTVDDGGLRQATVEIAHTPGAGGTTLARRLAWDMHRTFPVVLLRRTAPSVSMRIQELAQLTRLPVLIIAETDVIRPQDRERLYGDLLQNKVRFVMVSVVRSMQPQASDKTVIVQSPMSDREAGDFYSIYRERTRDYERRHELDRITTVPDLREYRSPFFYGLITYEANFVSIDKYVNSHLEGLPEELINVTCYLALVTKYSQGGIDETLLRVLSGSKPDSNGGLQAKFGAGAWRLLIRRNRGFRLMHPLLAEQVLKRQLGHLGGEARADELRRLTVQFMRDMVKAGGSRLVDVEKLMEQLFINTTREGAGGRFASLIEDLTPSGAQIVFDELVKLFPTNPHYLNHRGRHRIYKMREAYELAEQDLDAAISMADNDAVHHHTKGLVLRFWIERELSNLKARYANAEDLLAKIEPLEQRAKVAFERARSLRREDRFGYVTHVQMILYIANDLLSASGIRPGESLDRVPGRVGDWLRHNIPLAEDLLADAAAIHGEQAQSELEQSCTIELNKVYGNLNDLVFRWQKTVNEGHATPDLRRALARCYFVRRQRDWVALPEKEIRHIAELCRDNLSGPAVRDHDARLWFEACRRLPEFDYLDAIDRMQAWAKRTTSIEPWYNLFMLQTVRWMQGLSTDAQSIMEAIEQMRRARLAVRTDRSYRFYSLLPTWFPIVDAREVKVTNPQTRQLETWTPASRQRHAELAVVSGVIDDIKGQQAGYIRLGPSIRAFFVPGIEFLDPSNIGAQLTFHIGFAYEGLRAWVAQRPATASLQPTTSPLGASGNPPANAEVVLMPPLQPSFGVAGKLGRAAGEQEERHIFNFIHTEVLKAELAGTPLPLGDLGSRLRLEFKGETVHRRLGFGNLTDLLAAWKAFSIEAGRVRVARASRQA